MVSICAIEPEMAPHADRTCQPGTNALLDEHPRQHRARPHQTPYQQASEEEKEK